MIEWLIFHLSVEQEARIDTDSQVFAEPRPRSYTDSEGFFEDVRYYFSLLFKHIAHSHHSPSDLDLRKIMDGYLKFFSIKLGPVYMILPS